MVTYSHPIAVFRKVPLIFFSCVLGFLLLVLAGCASTPKQAVQEEPQAETATATPAAEHKTLKKTRQRLKIPPKRRIGSELAAYEDKA